MTATTGSPTDGATPGPMIRYEDINTPQSGPGEHFARYDALRAKGGMHAGVAGPRENPFWLVTQMEQVRQCFQDPVDVLQQRGVPRGPEPAVPVDPGDA